MQWEVVIGLETHTQLATRSKIFSGSSTAFGAEPNTQASAIDIALPGVLPVLNKQAVECAIRFGLAVGADINRYSIFARKNYFYPDLPKGYQISQYEEPVVKGGAIHFSLNEQDYQVRLTRAHLEEDAGKSLHEEIPGATGIDLNRAGTPLLEIVSEPDMRSAEEAVAYAKALHQIVTWIGICDGNMQEGSFRCDANVSVRPVGSKTFGTRCEIKNLNSFRFLERAILFEVERQIEILENGGSIVQETRLYDPDRDETRSMRSKEDAMDYRYFPDPDLLPVVIDEQWINEVKEKMPPLPLVLKERFITEYGLTEYDANLITSERALTDYFIALTQSAKASAKLCANWLTGEVMAALNRTQLNIKECPIQPQQLVDLVARIEDQTISGKIAKTVFEVLWQEGGDVDSVIEARGLKQVSDSSAIEKIVDELMASNPDQVAEFRAGKDKVLGFFVGKAMKVSGGKLNPTQLNDVLRKKLAG
ncbi:MAG: Asp-tRNA(Asn)/Glu-tRNA(Gln) amidotransferase subunit GatB [Betaproteobacteria bacterium]|nr:Asp-tRNA(Asn)/Glu-tRNA(Gln) amidotransferase subunit GatB [Betaproteobacteria bacterium]MDE2423058.1 Asp-tRNA(Asn)/Glu-tRNA(Gln) amidotransferase subunit GatB [Betaproteobacteria bacterium]